MACMRHGPSKRGQSSAPLRNCPWLDSNSTPAALRDPLATAPQPRSATPLGSRSSPPCSGAAAPPQRDAAARARRAALRAPRRAGLAFSSTLCGCSGGPERRQQRPTAAASRRSRRRHREWQPRRLPPLPPPPPQLRSAVFLAPAAGRRSWTPTAWRCPKTSASLRAPSRSRCACGAVQSALLLIRRYCSRAARQANASPGCCSGQWQRTSLHCYTASEWALLQPRAAGSGCLILHGRASMTAAGRAAANRHPLGPSACAPALRRTLQRCRWRRLRRTLRRGATKFSCSWRR